MVGRGNLGRSLARALRAAGHSTSLVPGRTTLATSAASGIVFLAVPDSVVGAVAAKIASTRPAPGLRFAHVSGALGLDALAPLRAHGVGSFHPLQSFPVPRDPSAFKGITVAVDWSEPALGRRLRGLARALGARPVRVDDAGRVLYHAAAVFASNFVNVSVAEGVRLLGRIGWTEDAATAALLPLVDGAVGNIRRQGVAGALTGPIRRGDAATVERHLAALEGPDADLYRMLGTIALDLARRSGLEPAAAERVSRALTRDVAATRRRTRR